MKDKYRYIEVVPYNSNWPKHFAKEAEKIKQALGENCIEIHHIGSTSVAGLAAKPLIDILPVVKDIRLVDNSISAMQELGYEARGEFGIAFRRFFVKRKDVRTHNVHVFEEGNSEIDRHLKFRGWMRKYPEDRNKYAELKLNLAEKFPNNIHSYCLGKEEFIHSINNNSDWKG